MNKSKLIAAVSETSLQTITANNVYGISLNNLIITCC